MTEYEPIEPAEAKPGEKVRLTHTGGSIIHGTVTEGAAGRLSNGISVRFDAGTDRYFYPKYGWTIERAIPELPTEPGFYSAVRTGSVACRLFRLRHEEWQELTGDPDAPGRDIMRDLRLFHSTGDLTRLVPEKESA